VIKILGVTQSNLTYRYIFSYNSSMKNGIVIQQRGGDFRLIDIPLNSKEMQLALDRSDIDASWSLMCDSIRYRLGIDIIGNYDLVSIFVNGDERPLH